jgi:hypothetical protein
MQHIIELVFLLGLALIAGGIACIYWPAALIFAGIAMVAAALRIAGGKK